MISLKVNKKSVEDHTEVVTQPSYTVTLAMTMESE